MQTTEIAEAHQRVNEIETVIEKLQAQLAAAAKDLETAQDRVFSLTGDKYGCERREYESVGVSGTGGGWTFGIATRLDK